MFDKRQFSEYLKSGVVAQDAADGWKEDLHPRGGTENKGQFKQKFENFAKVDDLSAASEGSKSRDYEGRLSDILAKAPKDEHGRLLAPNGRPTNLSKRQYAQVRTPEFKAWFGDWEDDPAKASKVVDENGEPLVVWHGTQHGGFTEFKDRDNREQGFFFSSEDRASWYAGSANDSPPVNVKIAPLFKDWDEVEEYASEVGIRVEHHPETDEDPERWEFKRGMSEGIAWEPSEARDEIQRILYEQDIGGDMYPCFLNMRNPERIDAKGEWAGNIDQVRSDPESQDGVIVENVQDWTHDEGSEFEDTNYIVFDPTQIKLAVGNGGAFSSSTNDIRDELPKDAAGRYLELVARE